MKAAFASIFTGVSVTEPLTAKDIQSLSRRAVKIAFASDPKLCDQLLRGKQPRLVAQREQWVVVIDAPVQAALFGRKSPRLKLDAGLFEERESQVKRIAAVAAASAKLAVQIRRDIEVLADPIGAIRTYERDVGALEALVGYVVRGNGAIRVETESGDGISIPASAPTRRSVFEPHRLCLTALVAGIRSPADIDVSVLRAADSSNVAVAGVSRARLRIPPAMRSAFPLFAAAHEAKTQVELNALSRRSIRSGRVLELHLVGVQAWVADFERALRHIRAPEPIDAGDALAAIAGSAD